MPKLLIVDDEADVREFAGRFFRKRGIEVILAASGEQALELLAVGPADLVLLDIRMGGMSGMDVLRKIKSEGSSVKVIMVSGIEDDIVTSEAKNLGVNGFIHKPLVLEELQAVVLRELNLCQ